MGRTVDPLIRETVESIAQFLRQRGLKVLAEDTIGMAFDDVKLTNFPADDLVQEVDMVIAIVNEGEIVFVVIDINVHIFVSVHVLVDFGWELGVAIYAFYEVFAVAPRLEIIRIA